MLIDFLFELEALKMKKIEVKIFDVVNGGVFRSTNYKVDEITKEFVKINNNVYFRKGDKLIGKIFFIKISDDKTKAVGGSFPIYA